MALVQLTNALKLVIVEKVHVHSGTTTALATRPLHERGLGKHERSIGTLKQTVAGVVKFPVLAATLPWSPGLVIAVIIRKLVLVVIIIGLRNHDAERIDAKTQKCRLLHVVLVRLLLAATPPWSLGLVFIIAVIIGLKLPCYRDHTH